MKFKYLKLVIILCCSSLLISSCGANKTEQAFLSVCNSKQGNSNAPAYSKDGDFSPPIIFTRGDKTKDFSGSKFLLQREAWKAEPGQQQLVGCITYEKEEVGKCYFSVKRKSKSSSRKRWVQKTSKRYNQTVTVEIREAKTGKLLDGKRATIKAPSCPTKYQISSIQPDSKKASNYIVSKLIPFVEHKL